VLQVSSSKNNSGFTLIEVMVAIVIMMVGMLGVLEAISVSTQHNLKNQLRGEGLRVGERYMAELRGKSFDAYSVSPSRSYATTTYNSQIRGIAKTYRIERVAQKLGEDASGNPTSVQLTVTVKWSFRNQSSVNQVVSVVGRP
jgi:type IV pilus assembly protein PilV